MSKKRDAKRRKRYLEFISDEWMKMPPSAKRAVREANPRLHYLMITINYFRNDDSL